MHALGREMRPDRMISEVRREFKNKNDTRDNYRKRRSLQKLRREIFNNIPVLHHTTLLFLESIKASRDGAQGVCSTVDCQAGLEYVASMYNLSSPPATHVNPVEVRGQSLQHAEWSSP
jgi:hypothetical protein